MSEERKPLESFLHRTGLKSRPLTDLYAFLLRSSWLTVVGLSFATFIGVNLVFASLYLIEPDSIGNSDGGFLDAFFFSVQTFGAIGYGFMYSQGVWANSVVVIEAFVSLLCIALLTGIVFAKFSRPHSRVIFSQPLLIEKRDGVPTLTFRVANERGNDVVEASIRVSALMTIFTKEGERMRRFFDLKLDRSSTPVFLLTWQIFHRITEDSPIYGMGPKELVEGDVRFVVALTGLDGTFAQTIHARHMYWAEDVLEGKRFADVIRPLEGKHVEMDFTKFHLTVDDDRSVSDRS